MKLKMTVQIICKYIRDGIYKKKEKSFYGDTTQEALEKEADWFSVFRTWKLLEMEVIEK